MPNENEQFWNGIISEYLKKNPDTTSGKYTPPVNGFTPDAANGRQILNILFVVDVSGSMKGTRIASVNYALENLIKEMRDRQDMNSTIKIGILEFADYATWRTATPIPLEDYYWTSIEAQPWFTNYGVAFLELEKKLHKNAFMNPDMGEYFAPLILFISDGEPVDVEEYPKALEKLQANKWFQKSGRYAIAVGEEAKSPEVIETLAQFTGDQANVRYVDDGAELCDLIQFITVRASEVQTSMVVSDGAGTNSIFKDRDDTLFSSLYKKKE